ncbi:hypothetical protein NXS97_00075 [Pantoea sp. B623]|uniref:hypothetical protein n=1 Tax=Pantoea sp. B623 TaxID=2974561 RepID=UPI0021690BC6|nr:hypothetical protein [Pantoea sp. B623]MCS4492611.1 hypothetical protein [Pantoea sp. B623]
MYKDFHTPRPMDIKGSLTTLSRCVEYDFTGKYSKPIVTFLDKEITQRWLDSEAYALCEVESAPSAPLTKQEAQDVKSILTASSGVYYRPRKTIKINKTPVTVRELLKKRYK